MFAVSFRGKVDKTVMDQMNKSVKVLGAPKLESGRGKKKEESEYVRKKSHRVKDKLKISSYPEASEAQESTLSLRLNQFPKRPHCLIRKESGDMSRRKRKSKTAEKGEEDKTEYTRPEVEESESSFEKVLGFCRTKLRSMDERRIEILEAMPEMDVIKRIKPDEGKEINEKQEKEEQGLSKRESPVKDSYFKFKSTPWQKQRTTALDLQAKGTESPKANINQILKGHAQKVSGHSLILGSMQDTSEFLRKVRMLRKESNSNHSTKNMQKIIEIKTRDECDKGQASVEVKEEEKSAEVKGEDAKLPEKKGKDKKQETQKKDTDKAEEILTKKEETAVEKKSSAEKVADLVKRVTYTDRLLLNRFRKDSTEKLKTPGAIIASVIEKLNNPFKDELQKKLEICLNGGDVNKKTDEPTEHKAAVKSPSDAALKTTVQKQRSAREATIDDQVNKSVEQLSKTKCARTSELRDIVAQAIKEHKIFCIFDNHWYIVRPVREELLNRGWLEVIPDRRLIPRRRPPPAGPAVERTTTPDFAMEAILTAREAIVDDYTDVMAKFPPSKINADKAKPQRKTSEDSLKEVCSEFRIVPPSPDRKKNNQDIRDFVGKCHYMVLRKQNLRMGKDRKGKANGKVNRSGKTFAESVANTRDGESPTVPSCPSSVSNMEDVIHTVQQNWKFLAQLPGKEKPKEEPRQQAPTDESEKESKISLSENDAKVASKIIQSSNARIHFMWLSIKPAMHLKCFNYSPEIVNKFQKTTFCTKIGLWGHLNNIQWYAHEVTFPAKSPRMYNTGEADDLQAFLQDFQMTACIGILKWLSETFFDKGVKGVQKKKGKVPVKALEFAIRQCERYIRFRENEDLNLMEDPKVMQEEWNTFLQWFYIITNDHGKLQETSNAQVMVLYTKAVEVLRVMKRHWPEMDTDGRLNIWIMKPYCASCGRGIFMTNNVYYIGQHSKYIVQKYIERPLLIYSTKFDIRQWFMITKLVPLEIWMYKECYLRFCSQPFALRNLHESVHLSNNSVQRKYVNQKDSGLPEQNMWDSNTFQQYLKTIGQPNAWDEVIYPGMRDAIISLMLAAQDTFDSQRRSWFEVYGADFMISASLKDGPWLIEINESPAMDPSTKVTARLCPQMLRDVIKVVVDKRANKNAPTGQWELVYRQNYSPSYGTISIDVKGKRIARASQNKTGYTNNWAPPPFFFNSTVGTKENSLETGDTTKYDIVRSYKTGKTDAGVNITKSSIWGNQVRGKLIKETSASSIEMAAVANWKTYWVDDSGEWTRKQPGKRLRVIAAIQCPPPVGDGNLAANRKTIKIRLDCRAQHQILGRKQPEIHNCFLNF